MRIRMTQEIETRFKEDDLRWAVMWTTHYDNDEPYLINKDAHVEALFRPMASAKARHQSVSRFSIRSPPTSIASSSALVNAPIFSCNAWTSVCVSRIRTTIPPLGKFDF